MRVMRLMLVLLVGVLAVGALATWWPADGPGRRHGRWLSTAADQAASATSPRIAFAPRGGARETLCALIRDAHGEILVLGSLQDAHEVVAALIAAAQRGVKVAAVVPAPSPGEPTPDAATLAAAGAQVALDAEHRHLDGALLVIDGERVATAGSLGDAATREDVGVVLVVQDAACAAAGRDAWQVHQAHARPWPAPRREPQAPAGGNAGAGGPGAGTSRFPVRSTHRQDAS